MNIRDRIKELRRVRAGDLRPHPKNWRKHPEEQQNALRGILAEVGFVDALMVRELPDGALQIVDGHLRAETTPDSMIPVLVVDLDDKEAEKVLATFDPLAGMAELDENQLQELLKGIETESEALAALLDELAIEANKGIVAQILEDEVPEPPDEAVTKRGDLIILGNHRLLCGDSGKPEDLDTLLGGAVIHMVNTDPPYNVNVEPASNSADTGGQRPGKRPQHTPSWRSLDGQRARGIKPPRKNEAPPKKTSAKGRRLMGDFVSDEEFAKRLLAWFGNISRVLVPGRCFYLWGGYANIANYPPALTATDLYMSQCLIWVKGHPVITRKDYMGDHEWCFYGWRKGAAHEFYGANNITDVWQVKKVSPQKMIHLTEKPVELAARAMQYSSRSGENVLDLFGGSGSTLIAAEQTERKAFLMELDPLYCDVIVERYEKFTGKKAERIAGDTAA